jgi:CVNH domain
MRGDTLYARCQDASGSWIKSSLADVYRCTGDIANINGSLQCDESKGLPAGDYAASCSDLRMRFGWLYARCQTRDGNWVDTSLPAARCNGGISNINGQLTCANIAAREWDNGGSFLRLYGPRGSYRETCRDIQVSRNQLRALCQNSSGNWVNSNLDNYGSCVGDIVNDNGQLECTRSGARGVPRGDYAQTCRNIYVRGDTLRAQCQRQDGQWAWTQLNDWDNCRGGISNNNGQLTCNR